MKMLPLAVGALIALGGAVLGFLLKPSASPPASIDHLERVWRIRNSQYSPFNCKAGETEPCHLGSIIGKEDDDKYSAWLIDVSKSDRSCPNNRQKFIFVAMKREFDPSTNDLKTTPVGHGRLCPDEATSEIDIQGTGTFIHGAGTSEHTLRITLEQTGYGERPFRANFDMSEDSDGGHLHNGTGHGED
jgi:hypothetical protein